MNIGIVGLGLIGGSLARAIRANTAHTVWGADLQRPVVYRAKLLEAGKRCMGPDAVHRRFQCNQSRHQQPGYVCPLQENLSASASVISERTRKIPAVYAPYLQGFLSKITL